MSNTTVKTLPFGKKIIYALGQFGWSLGSFAILNFLVYFYMPPETGERIFEPRIFQGSILGILTVIGLINSVGRVFDAVTDPVVAGLSDRSKSPMGRRRKFLAIGALPFGILSILVFTPLTPNESIINSIWLAVTVLLFYVFYTMYVTPFFALVSELGHNPKERLLLSTMISITWAVGAAVGSQAIGLQGMFESNGMESMKAFQLVMLIFGVVATVFMYLPVIFIKEKDYSLHTEGSEEGIFEALKSAFKNRNFKIFVISDFAYWAALVFIQMGLVYYVTILLGLEKEFYSQLFLYLFGLSFLFYIPVNILANKIGKKKLVMIAFVIFAIVFSLFIFFGKYPIDNRMEGYIIVLLSAIPMAIFGILPNAMVADMAEADGIENGNFKAGIFFGARTFMSKMGQGLGALIFPSFLLLGMSPENDIGVRITAVAALFFCILGFVVLLKYNEKDILKTLATHEELNPHEKEEIEGA